MKILLLLFVLTVLNANASLYSQNAALELSVSQKSVRQVLKMIESKTNFRFFYNDQFSDLNKTVSVAFKDKNINEVLELLLAQTNVTYRILDNDVVVITPTNAGVLQQVKITGKVIDATTNETLPGVNVIVEGTTVGTTTDMNGNYTLEVPNASANLIFSFIGYTTESVAINGRQSIDVTLVPDIKKLDEVVVVGYGVQKKKLVTGATVQVSGENLSKLNTINALTAVQSQSSGINIVPVSGEPGQGFKVTIRGIGTTGNSDPLYVIDGVAGGNINSISPADIESMDVLKDAASAAIYGSRAANGVILVTTKRGQSGKVQISYDGFYGVQNVYKMPDLLNAKEYMSMQDELNLNTGQPLNDWKTILGPNYDDVMSGKNQGTNWVELMRRKNAPTQNHSLNITGGNEVSKFSIGASYTAQTGVLGVPVEPKWERTTFRLNSDHVILKGNGFDAIKFEETLNYNYVVNSGIAIGNQYSNDLSGALRGIPIMPNYGDKGNYFNYADMQATGFDKFTAAYSNPIADMIYNNGLNLNKSHNLNASANLQIQPIKGLTFKSQFGYKMSSNSYRSFKPVYEQLSVTDQNLVSKVTQNMGSGWNYTWENTLNYKFSIQNHHIDALVGQSMEKWGMGENLQVTNGNLLFSDFDHAYLQNSQGVAAGTTTIVQPDNNGNGPWGAGGLASFFGRINYDYNETYMLSLIMRADGSSNFNKSHRWGYFPSISAGWVLSNENFMKSGLPFIDFFKLRGSWGQNGNQAIPAFQYTAPIYTGASGAYSFGNNKDSQTTGGYALNLPNPIITWETSQQTDIGVDARFLKSRLSATFDWYKKTTKDWLVRPDQLGTIGTPNPTWVNGGTVDNKGAEISLGWNDHMGKDFTYGITATLAYNKNMVTDIKNSEKVIHGATNVLSQGTTEMYRAQKGYPIGYFYGYRTAGIFQNEADINAWRAAGNGIFQSAPQPGDVKFVDTDHNGVIDEKDKTIIGDPNPDYNLGLSLNLGYKGFDFVLAGHGAFGQQIAKSYRKFVDSHYDNFTTDVFQRWHGEGTSNKYPRLTDGANSNFQQISDIYIENGDYFKIQNITLGYDFKKLMKKLPFAQVRLYVTAQNIYTFTKYTGMDPEIGSDAGTNSATTPFAWATGIDIGYYPMPRTYLMGLSLKF